MPKKQKKQRNWKKIAAWLFGLGITTWCLWFLMATLTVQTYAVNIYQSVESVPERPVGIVLGGGMKDDTTMSDAQYLRVVRGVELYKAGKVLMLVMSGDDGANRKDEVTAMKKLAVELGVPEADIMLDPHGYRTYLSCKRAAEEFGFNIAIVISQNFHLPRIRYFCENQGIDTIGLAADDPEEQSVKGILWNTHVREWLARMKGWGEVEIKK